MHIYIGQMYQLQLTICLWNTTTPNKYQIQQNAHTLKADVPPILAIDVWNTTTPNTCYKQQNAHIHRADVTSPIDHGCMEYCNTIEVSCIAECTYSKAPFLQLKIDLWNTMTPNKFHIQQEFTYMQGRCTPFQHIGECTHIQERYTLPIDHSCMEHHYTEYVLHIAECTYT